MNIAIDLFTFIFLIFSSILIFVLILIVSKSKNIVLTKKGIVIDEKQQYNTLYYITELMQIVEKKFYIKYIERVEAMMSHSERLLLSIPKGVLIRGYYGII